MVPVVVSAALIPEQFIRRMPGQCEPGRLSRLELVWQILWAKNGNVIQSFSVGWIRVKMLPVFCRSLDASVTQGR